MDDCCKYLKTSKGYYFNLINLETNEPMLLKCETALAEQLLSLKDQKPSWFRQFLEKINILKPKNKTFTISAEINDKGATIFNLK